MAGRRESSDTTMADLMFFSSQPSGFKVIMTTPSFPEGMPKSWRPTEPSHPEMRYSGGFIELTANS